MQNIPNRALLFSCVDPRLTKPEVNLGIFYKTDPGNIIPTYQSDGALNLQASSIAKMVEVFLGQEDPRHIVVMGHSKCLALGEIYSGNNSGWTNNGPKMGNNKSPVDLEKENVLLGIKNLMGYPNVEEKVARGSLKIHALYQELGAPTKTFAYNPKTEDFDIKVGLTLKEFDSLAGLQLLNAA